MSISGHRLLTQTHGFIHHMEEEMPVLVIRMKIVSLNLYSNSAYSLCTQFQCDSQNCIVTLYVLLV